jgi:integrase
MASIKFNIITKGNPSNLNIRFYHGREIDCNAKSDILIDPKLWSNKMQNLKPAVDQRLKNLYQTQIENLKKEITLQFNKDYSEGALINSKWLNNTVKTIHKRPTGENDYSMFFVPFIEKYADESENRINLKTGKKIATRTIQKYRTTIKQIKAFENALKLKLKLTDINLEFHKKFTNYLKLEQNYSNTLIEKIISQIKGFIREAKEMGYEINDEIESKKFTFNRDETIDTYLNTDEIDLIFKLDLSDNESLDNVRDIFIIGLWTGLRISDLNRIDQFHFSNNSIKIIETQKTGSTVEIPIHPMVKEILKKHNNELPRIISEQKFNNYIKKVCELAGIDEMVLGSVKNAETNRKEKGYFEKFKLITSHTARRSFATNHYGKIDDRTLMAITTHKSVSQFHKYIKTTQKEYSDRLAKYWEEQEGIKLN